MGLDTVELVMRTEEVFAIDLPDEDCERVRSVQDLYTLVLRKLGLPDQEPRVIEAAGLGRSRLPGPSRPLGLGTNEPWSSPDVWRTLKAIIEDQLQIDPEEITPEARFIEDLGSD